MKSIPKIIAYLFLLLATNMFSQQVRLDAVLDTAKIRIGEQAKVDIYVTYSSKEKGIKIQWPSIGDTITGKIEVISVSPIDTTLPDKTNSNKIFQHQQIIVSVYDSGFYAMPGFEFIIDNDTAHPLYTNPLFLEVHTVPTDTSAAKLKDIKPPFGEEFNWKWYLNYVYIGCGILALIIIVVLVTLYYARKNKQVIREPEKPKVPPHITALAALEKIKEDVIWKEGKVKEYYSSISETIRAYIEDRFNVNALESTTDEIMTAFRSQVVDKESKDKLQQLLMLSDLVKFAKMSPIEDEHNFTLKNAFDFVNGTKREDEIYIAPEQTNEVPHASSPAPVVSDPGHAPAAQKIESPMPVGGVTGNAEDKVKTTADLSSSPKKNKFAKPLKIAGIIVGVLIVLLIALKVFLFSSGTGAMALMAEGLNKMCPLMVDADTRLDKVSVVDEKVFEFDYSLVKVSVSEIDVSALEEQIKPMIIEQARSNPQMEQLRKNQVTLKYSYKDKNGEVLFTVEVKPEDYNTYY